MGVDAQYRHLVGRHLAGRCLAGRARLAFAAALLVAALGGVAATAPIAGERIAEGPAGDDCRLALVFALDVSASVDDLEYRLQLDGLAAALEDASVQAALFAGGAPVALAAFEWSGIYRQAPVAGWRIIDGPRALRSFAAQLRTRQRGHGSFATALGRALLHARALLDEAPLCARQVIDVSGDGISNAGVDPRAVHAGAGFAGITINGLVVGTEPAVRRYYERHVVRGPGAFVETARDYRDYARAMRRKLLRELGRITVAGEPGGAAAERVDLPCTLLCPIL